GNNGNVLFHSMNDGSTRNQSFGYDSLNRLAAAGEGSTWSQSYVYDRFGNRALLSSSDDPSVGMDKVFVATTTSSSSVPFNGNNRWTFVGAAYDTAGSGNLSDVV